MVSSCQIMGYISVMLHRRLSQNHQAIELWRYCKILQGIKNGKNILVDLLHFTINVDCSMIFLFLQCVKLLKGK